MATVLGDSRQKETLNTLDYTSSSAAYEVALLNSKPITNPDLGYNFQPSYSIIYFVVHLHYVPKTCYTNHFSLSKQCTFLYPIWESCSYNVHCTVEQSMFYLCSACTSLNL